MLMAFGYNVVTGGISRKVDLPTINHINAVVMARDINGFGAGGDYFVAQATNISGIVPAATVEVNYVVTASNGSNVVAASTSNDGFVMVATGIYNIVATVAMNVIEVVVAAKVSGIVAST